LNGPHVADPSTDPFQETLSQASEDDQPVIGLSDETTSPFQLPPIPKNAEQPPLGADDECQQPAHDSTIDDRQTLPTSLSQNTPQPISKLAGAAESSDGSPSSTLNGLDNDSGVGIPRFLSGFREP